MEGSIVTEYQPAAPIDLSAIAQPRCPACKQSRMTLSMIEPGPTGFDYRKFGCRKCGHVDTMIISSDPMEFNVRGWLRS
jgi:hypothetical protein